MKRILWAFLFASSFAAAAAPQTLVKDGVPAMEIIIDANSPPAVEFAAFELQKYVRLLTGALPPVHNREAEGWDKVKIHLGLPSSKNMEGVREKFKKDFDTLKGTDGNAVRNNGNKLYIFADCPKGVLTGVYRFLVKNTDLIWPRPAGELAIFTPQSTLTVSENNYLDAPKFKAHGFVWNYGRLERSPELELWCARMGYSLCVSLREELDTWRKKLGFVDGYFNEFGGGHNLVSFWLPLAMFAKDHPDFYMMVDGQRVLKAESNLCHTNPEMAKALTRRVLEVIPTLPSYISCVNLMIEDNSVTCECPECLKPITLPDGSVLTKDDESFRSTQFFMFFNQVARAVAEKHPKMMLKSYGYYYTAIPPKVRLERNIVVSFCPYIRNDKEPLSGPSNAKWKKRTDEWLANTPNILWREYYYSGARFPRPIADIAAQDLRYVQQKGLARVTSEFTWSDDGHVPADKMPASEFWDTTAMEAWTMSQLIWDPFQDPAKLREDYLRRTYREAAPDMAAYYAMIHKAWLGDPLPSVFNDNVFKSAGHYIVEKNLADPCRAALEKAEAAARHPDSLRLVKANRAVFEKWIKQAQTDKLASLDVPKLKCDEFPPFDLKTGPWAKAGEFPPLAVMGNPGVKSKYDTVNKIFHDGRSFYLGFHCKKDPKTIWTRLPAGSKRDDFPSGDHVEIFVANAKDGYYHLAFDVRGNVYDARLTDPKWDAPWEVKTKELPDGWAAVAKIPLDSVGFEMLKSNRLRMLLYRANFDAERKAEHSSWGGGQVHAADSFGEVVCGIE